MFNRIILSVVLALVLSACTEQPTPIQLPPDPIPTATTRTIKLVQSSGITEEFCYDGVVYLSSYYYNVTPKISRTGEHVYCE